MDAGSCHRCPDGNDGMCDVPAQADAFFPDYSDWVPVFKEQHETDERHAFRYQFVDYVKP